MTTEQLLVLADFQYNATPVEFRQIFPPTVADHLWDKFENRCNGNLLTLVGLLDDGNVQRLVNRLNVLLQEGE